MNKPIRRKCGSVLICVLACCLTAISLGATAVQLSLRSLRESRQTLRMRQTQWLLSAGVQRARRNVQDPNYDGEEWHIPASVLQDADARILIQVAPSTVALNTTASAEGAGVELRVSVTAVLGSSQNAELQICRTHTMVVPSRISPVNVLNHNPTQSKPEE